MTISPKSRRDSAPHLRALTPAAAPCPASVSAASWALLAQHVEDAQRRSAIATMPLRAVVQGVVRELRTAGESWDAVYDTLRSAVASAGPRLAASRECETHESRSAALVAHMHSWADVERLAELEGEEATG